MKQEDVVAMNSIACVPGGSHEGRRCTSEDTVYFGDGDDKPNCAAFPTVASTQLEISARPIAGKPTQVSRCKKQSIVTVNSAWLPK